MYELPPTERGHCVCIPRHLGATVSQALNLAGQKGECEALQLVLRSGSTELELSEVSLPFHGGSAEYVGQENGLGKAVWTMWGVWDCLGGGRAVTKSPGALLTRVLDTDVSVLEFTLITTP